MPPIRKVTGFSGLRPKLAPRRDPQELFGDRPVSTQRREPIAVKRGAPLGKLSGTQKRRLQGGLRISTAVGSKQQVLGAKGQALARQIIDETDEAKKKEMIARLPRLVAPTAPTKDPRLEPTGREKLAKIAAVEAGKRKRVFGTAIDPDITRMETQVEFAPTAPEFDVSPEAITRAGTPAARFEESIKLGRQIGRGFGSTPKRRLMNFKEQLKKTSTVFGKKGREDLVKATEASEVSSYFESNVTKEKPKAFISEGAVTFVGTTGDSILDGYHVEISRTRQAMEAELNKNPNFNTSGFQQKINKLNSLMSRRQKDLIIQRGDQAFVKELDLLSEQRRKEAIISDRESSLGFAGTDDSIAGMEERRFQQISNNVLSQIGEATSGFEAIQKGENEKFEEAIREIDKKEQNAVDRAIEQLEVSGTIPTSKGEITESGRRMLAFAEENVRKTFDRSRESAEANRDKKISKSAADTRSTIASLREGLFKEQRAVSEGRIRRAEDISKEKRDEVREIRKEERKKEKEGTDDRTALAKNYQLAKDQGFVGDLLDFNDRMIGRTETNEEALEKTPEELLIEAPSTYSINTKLLDSDADQERFLKLVRSYSKRGKEMGQTPSETKREIRDAYLNFNFDNKEKQARGDVLKDILFGISELSNAEYTRTADFIKEGNFNRAIEKTERLALGDIEGGEGLKEKRYFESTLFLSNRSIGLIKEVEKLEKIHDTELFGSFDSRLTSGQLWASESDFTLPKSVRAKVTQLRSSLTNLFNEWTSRNIGTQKTPEEMKYLEPVLTNTTDQPDIMFAKLNEFKNAGAIQYNTTRDSVGLPILTEDQIISKKAKLLLYQDMANKELGIVKQRRAPTVFSSEDLEDFDKLDYAQISELSDNVSNDYFELRTEKIDDKEVFGPSKELFEQKKKNNK